MSLSNPASYLGKSLKACRSELKAIGALSTWAPFSFQPGGIKGLEVRFANHWGELVGAGQLRYMVTVTDRTGMITHVETVELAGMESRVVQLSAAGKHPDIGAIYLGCISPSVLEWSANQSIGIDYFYLAYDCDASYSLVHSQPVEIQSTLNHSSWTNCIEVLAVESPRILIGNPSLHSSAGTISLGRADRRRRERIKMRMEPFEVVQFSLDAFPDGWYSVSCDVGKNYAHLLRVSKEALVVRHM